MLSTITGPPQRASQPTSPASPLQVPVALQGWLLVHLFVAALGLLSLVRPSQIVHDIQRKATTPYSRTLGLDLNYDYSSAPFFLTHGTEFDVDAIVDVEVPSGGAKRANWDDTNRKTERIVWPPSSLRGTDAYQRFKRFAILNARFAEDDQEGAPRLSTAIADHVMRLHDVEQAKVRVRRHFALEIEQLRTSTTPLDPFDPNTYRTDYEYVATRDEAGEVFVVREGATRDVALPRTSPGSAP